MKTVVFIHGFILSGWVFSYLSSYLSKQGYRCYCFNYSTRSQSLQQSAQKLSSWLEKNKLRNSCFVCHSLGGLVLYNYFINHCNGRALAHVVALGSPFNGSVVAVKLTQNYLGRWLLGDQTNSSLIDGINHWPDQVDLGVIAGNKGIGVGRLLGLPANIHSDGTVLVKEVLVKGQNDYIILSVTHTQLLFSISVAKQIDYYFQHGEFHHRVSSL